MSSPMDSGSLLFTCITCRVGFPEAPQQRDHYRSDWHKYNLKRKVADLPPVTAENFKERVLAQRIQAEAEVAKKTTLHCEACGKQFKSDGAYENHLGSAKHKQALANFEQAAEQVKGSTQEVKGSTQEVKGSTQQDSKVKEMNSVNALKNKSSQKPATEESMETAEGEGESDEESWDEEDEALGVEECLFCPTISGDAESNASHMSEKHSFFIPDLEYLVDLEGFLSYLGEKVGACKMCLWCGDKGKMFHSTKSVQQHMQSKGHTQLYHEGDAVYEYAEFYDYTPSYPDGAEGKEDEVVDPLTLEENEDYTLKLPSGATIGHRALKRFYKQNLVPHQGPTGHQSRSLRNVMAQHKALGWTGSQGKAAVQRAKNIGYMQRLAHKQQLKMSLKTNKFQPHLRPQVVF